MQFGRAVVGMENTSAFEIGVISDTHGVVDALALTALAGVNHIIHAGDFESYKSLRALKKLAPVTVVAGNVDVDVDRRNKCYATATITLASMKFYIIHDLARFDILLFDSGLAAVIHGHTHAPSIVWKNGVLFFNPGSARHPRSQTPRSVGRLRIENGQIQAKHHYF